MHASGKLGNAPPPPGGLLQVCMAHAQQRCACLAAPCPADIADGKWGRGQGAGGKLQLRLPT